jgi:Icc-related predicted phosphoesterase
MTDKLKILAASDIHADLALAERLAVQAEQEQVDLVILAGDLTLFDQSSEGIIGPFAKRGQKVLLMHGNHETQATTQFLADLYDATNLHGYSLDMKGVGIFGAGGAELGPHPTSSTEIYEELKKAHDKIKHLEKKLMVVHEHPSMTNMEFQGRFPGSSAIRNAAETFQPDILICGHVHEAGGIEEKIGKTKVINVAKTPRIIEL